MDIRRDLRCTMCERDKSITKFLLSVQGTVAQDILLGNFVLRPGEAIDRDAEYEFILRRKIRNQNGEGKVP